MAERNIAIVSIPAKVILDWLQFEDGKICQLRQGTRLDEVEIIIEHPDLPKMRTGDQLMRIVPTYKFWKRGKFVKMCRIDPPKGAKHG